MKKYVNDKILHKAYLDRVDYETYIEPREANLGSSQPGDLPDDFFLVVASIVGFIGEFYDVEGDGNEDK